jgi:hypothetical protein
VRLFDVPNVRADWLVNLIWEWAKMIMENPQSLMQGLDNVQKELMKQNQALIECLNLI